MDNPSAPQGAARTVTRGEQPQRLLTDLPDDLLHLVLAPHHMGAACTCRRLRKIVLAHVKTSRVTITDEAACAQGLEFAASSLPSLSQLSLRAPCHCLSRDATAFGPLSRLSHLTSLHRWTNLALGTSRSTNIAIVMGRKVL